MIEGSESVPHTNGSGRPNNIYGSHGYRTPNTAKKTLLRNKEDVTWQVRAPPGPGRGGGSECWRAGAAGPPRRGPGPGAPHGLPAGPLYNHTS